MNGGFVAAAVICVAAVVWWMIKSEKGARSLFLSAFSGIAAIFAVNTIGLISGVTIAVNWYTLGISGIMGIPGVVAILIGNMMLK